MNIKRISIPRMSNIIDIKIAEYYSTINWLIKVLSFIG